jgi:hypothetical protein
MEASAITGVASRAALFNFKKYGIAIAIERDGVNHLGVARSGPFLPEFAAAT